MRITLSQAAPADLHVDAVAVPIASSEPLGQPAVDLDRALGGLIQEVIESGEHRGRLNEIMVLPTSGRVSARRVLLHGLGAAEDLDGQRLRGAYHELVRAARTYGYKRLALLHTAPLQQESLGGVVEGCVLGTWEARSRQTNPHAERSTIEEIQLCGFGHSREREVVAAQELGDATNQAREWQNTPGNELTPEALAQEARKIAERHGLEVEVLGPAELRAGGYNLLIGVAQGSMVPARMISLTHRGASGRPDAPTLAIVGKGITFDAGGISIKPAKDMDRMKGDMAGAAAVLAAIDVIAARRVPLNVLAVVAATENMPGGQAQRPGDVVLSANGKTVEIINTDAEGRLVLADAVTYAIRHGATRIVDLATLTGSAGVAIGHAATAALCSDEALWAQVAQAAELAGDRVARLPIYADYRALLSSKIADLRNSDFGEAGMITGGMFIQQFTDNLPWAHLDIAASSWNTNTELTSIPRGPTGAGTRILVHLAELMAATAR